MIAVAHRPLPLVAPLARPFTTSSSSRPTQLFINILMINALIAMMAKTFDRIHGQLALNYQFMFARERAWRSKASRIRTPLHSAHHTIPHAIQHAIPHTIPHTISHTVPSRTPSRTPSCTPSCTLSRTPKLPNLAGRSVLAFQAIQSELVLIPPVTLLAVPYMLLEVVATRVWLIWQRRCPCASAGVKPADPHRPCEGGGMWLMRQLESNPQIRTVQARAAGCG